MAENAKKGEQAVEEVEVALDRTSDFFERHKSLLIGVVAAIVILVGGYFGVKYLVVAPREKKAASQMFHAQNYFEMGALQQALDGDGQHAGFLEVADSYRMTRSGKLARYYAGLVYLHQGQFEDAVECLRKFRTSDPVLYMLSHQALGDAYLEAGRTGEALNAYRKGASKYSNEVFTPGLLVRVALTCRMQGRVDEARKAYIRIRDEFPMSQEAQDVERQIARLDAEMGR